MACTVVSYLTQGLSNTCERYSKKYSLLDHWGIFSFSLKLESREG